MPIAEPTPAAAPASSMLPEFASEPGGALDFLLHRAAIAPLDATAWVRVTGSDRVRWLNGMVTNSIQSLAPGEGCYNFILNAQGRIQGDLTAFALQDALLLQTSTAQVEKLLPLLDRFIIMDDVELAPDPTFASALVLAGPDAPSLLASLCLPVPSPVSLATGRFHGDPITIVAQHSPLVPRFELWAAPELLARLREALPNVAGATHEALEAVRLLEGTPRYGTDIRDSATARDLPQETGQTRALHFAKGCYLGQEIVERIRSRGAVHRTFAGFSLQCAQPGTTPTPGILTVDAKAVGEITSVASIPRPGGEPLHLALGYLRREVLDSTASPVIEYPCGTAIPRALPTRIF